MIKRHEKFKLVGTAIALMAVLSMTDTGWAKKNSGGGSGAAQGTFVNGDRGQVSVSVPVTIQGCTTQTFTIRAYIFQPSGRMFAIGNSPLSPPLACTETSVDLTVDAFQGLEFKPGPATLMYKITVTTADPDGMGPLVGGVIEEEYGSRIDLH